jgi:signal transduction histidine kinase/ActR/RegA family two-component response regulator
MAVELQAILELARDLQGATSIQELVVATRRAVRTVSSFESVWIFALEPGAPRRLRALAAAGDVAPGMWEHAPMLMVEGDAMLEEICASDRPVVVIDARTDPRTDKAMVAHFGNRTIVNIPMFAGGERVGALGMGTFGEEGVRPPEPAQFDHLRVFATQLAAAFQRVRLLEDRALVERERAALRERLAAAQRVESLALLAGGVAHDFNNLLTVVMNDLRFVAEGPLTDAQRADLSAARGACLRARDVTQQLLAVGRRGELRVEAVDVDARVRGLVEILRRLIPERIYFYIVASRERPRIAADPAQFDRLLMNLCLNARDAMPEGGRLTIACDVEELNGRQAWARPGRYARITVADTGHGIAPGDVERVFEPFFTLKPEGHGTGLGLAVSLGIAQQHGGTIRCESEPGRGTRFEVYLPFGAPPSASEAPAPEAPRAASRERVLLAEDDAAVREVARRILARVGYEVVAVPDGLRAIEAALASRFDLILLDVVMPGATGREAYERIRAARPDSAFVFVSGYTHDEMPTAFLRDARVELVSKPYEPEHLLRAIRRALDARPTGG